MGVSDSDISVQLKTDFPVILYAGCGYGWVMAFFTDTTLWKAFTSEPAVSSAYSIYFVLSCLFLFLGSFLISLRFFDAGVLVSSAGAVLAMFALRLIPGEIPLYLSSVILGCSAGLTFALCFLFLIHRLRAPVKVMPILLSILFFYTVSALLLFISSAYGRSVAFFSALPLPVIGAWAARKSSPLKYPPGQTKRRPPVRLLAWQAILVALMYTAYNIVSAYTVKAGSGYLSSEAVFDWAVRVSVIAFILFWGRSLNMIRLLYGSFILIMMAVAFRFMGPMARVPSGLLINTSFALADLCIAVIVVDLSAAYSNSRWVFSCAMFVTASSTIGGYLAGNALYLYIFENPALFMGVVFSLFCTALLFAPPLLRIFEQELVTVYVADTDSQESVVRNPSYARLKAGNVLEMLDERYDEKYRLTKREREVALLLLDRYDYDAIAKRLGISVNTVKTHAKTIYQKYDIRGRKDLIELSLKPAAGQ